MLWSATMQWVLEAFISKKDYELLDELFNPETP